MSYVYSNVCSNVRKEKEKKERQRARARERGERKETEKKREKRYVKGRKYLADQVDYCSIRDHLYSNLS